MIYRKIQLLALIIALSCTAMFPCRAFGLSFVFSDSGTGTAWGIMNISVVDNDTLQVGYTAISIPVFSEATGFGFAFSSAQVTPNTITNPDNASISYDLDSLDWLVLTNLNAIPNPENSTFITKNDFYFGSTAGGPNNITPPGIRPGQYDLFYLNFSPDVSFVSTTFDLAQFVDVVGVRLQSLPDSINGGSLFLVGTPAFQPVPEPATIILFGAGLSGLIIYGRMRKQL